jgi:outer membrane protein OmpA-like peptidoglycan-associated protein
VAKFSSRIEAGVKKRTGQTSRPAIHLEGGTIMSQTRVLRKILGVAVLIFISAVSCIAVTAEQVEVSGLIKARSGDRIILQTKGASDVTVLLTDTTDVGQVEGMLKVRHKEMSMAALIPGLAIKVKGSYNTDNQLVAETIRFKGNDLARAQSIQAGMHETKQETEANKAELAKQSAAINEAIARFGQMDDYYIFDELVVLFGNGKTAVESEYIPRLQALAEKANGIEGYMIEVKGYASVTGSAELNQSLSEERANNVTHILIQNCKVPMTRMLAPGAMGKSEQVGEADTQEGQAQNRRVVVRVLQNKAIAGTLSE